MNSPRGAVLGGRPDGVLIVPFSSADETLSASIAQKAGDTAVVLAGAAAGFALARTVTGGTLASEKPASSYEKQCAGEQGRYCSGGEKYPDWSRVHVCPSHLCGTKLMDEISHCFPLLKRRRLVSIEQIVVQYPKTRV